MTNNTSYAVIIGGTEMLEGVCHWLTEEGYEVHVIHRNYNRFIQMREKALHPEKLHAITVDYHDDTTLQKEISKTIQQYKKCPDLIVSWIHNSAPNALPTILKEVTDRTDPWRLIHVQGSSSFFVKENTTVPKSCEYRRVYLGFVQEEEDSRCLTNEEIANGLIKVIKRDFKETVIGTLRPWNKRLS